MRRTLVKRRYGFPPVNLSSPTLYSKLSVCVMCGTSQDEWRRNRRQLTVCFTPYRDLEFFDEPSSSESSSRNSEATFRKAFRSAAVLVPGLELAAAEFSPSRGDAASDSSPPSSPVITLNFPPARRSFASLFLAPAIVYLSS